MSPLELTPQGQWFQAWFLGRLVAMEAALPSDARSLEPLLGFFKEERVKIKSAPFDLSACSRLMEQLPQAVSHIQRQIQYYQSWASLKQTSKDATRRAAYTDALSRYGLTRSAKQDFLRLMELSGQFLETYYPAMLRDALVKGSADFQIPVIQAERLPHLLMAAERQILRYKNYENHRGDYSKSVSPEERQQDEMRYGVTGDQLTRLMQESVRYLDEKLPDLLRTAMFQGHSVEQFEAALQAIPRQVLVSSRSHR